jgi:hypothetical protein
MKRTYLFGLLALPMLIPAVHTAPAQASTFCTPIPSNVVMSSDDRYGGTHDTASIPDVVSITSEPTGCSDYDIVVVKLDKFSDQQFHIRYTNDQIVDALGHKVNVTGTQLVLTVDTYAPPTKFDDFDLHATSADHAVVREIKCRDTTTSKENIVIGTTGKVPFGFIAGPGGKSGLDQITVFLKRQ